MKHWSELLACSCGKRFRSYAAEAFHRHNFPTFCRKPKVRIKAHKCAKSASNMTDNDQHRPEATEAAPQSR